MSVPQIDIHQALTTLDAQGARFIDIRDQASFREGHIPGAELISNENIQDFIAEADKAAPVIVYCYHGNSSRGATQFLLEQGFSQVVSMMGGFEAWRVQFPDRVDR